MPILLDICLKVLLFRGTLPFSASRRGVFSLVMANRPDPKPMSPCCKNGRIDGQMEWDRVGWNTVGRNLANQLIIIVNIPLFTGSHMSGSCLGFLPSIAFIATPRRFLFENFPHAGRFLPKTSNFSPYEDVCIGHLVGFVTGIYSISKWNPHPPKKQPCMAQHLNST